MSSRERELRCQLRQIRTKIVSNHYALADRPLFGLDLEESVLYKGKPCLPVDCPNFDRHVMNCAKECIQEHWDKAGKIKYELERNGMPRAVRKLCTKVKAAIDVSSEKLGTFSAEFETLIRKWSTLPTIDIGRQRVAKVCANGILCFGTVTKHTIIENLDEDLWEIEYDNGHGEEIDTQELQQVLDMYSKCKNIRDVHRTDLNSNAMEAVNNNDGMKVMADKDGGTDNDMEDDEDLPVNVAPVAAVAAATASNNDMEAIEILQPNKAPTATTAMTPSKSGYGTATATTTPINGHGVQECEAYMASAVAATMPIESQTAFDVARNSHGSGGMASDELLEARRSPTGHPLERPALELESVEVKQEPATLLQASNLPPAEGLQILGVEIDLTGVPMDTRHVQLDNEMKRCPKCNDIIIVPENNVGCGLVSCDRCDTCICWHCGAIIKRRGRCLNDLCLEARSKTCS